MKYCLLLLLLMVASTPVFADSHVDVIQIVPENPDPLAPFRVYLEVTLPDRCWTQGPVGDLEFTDLDSYDGDDCSGGLFLYGITFDQAGLEEGHHTVTVTEWHDSLRDPGSWEHVVEFTVGDPPVGSENLTWSTVKALFR